MIEVMEQETPVEKRGTEIDVRDMYRVGKTQELRRNFRLISILGFTAVLMCTWEAILFTASYILPNGGLAAMVWMYVISIVIIRPNITDIAITNEFSHCSRLLS